MACLNPFWIVNPKYKKLANGKVPTLDITPNGKYVNEYGYPDYMVQVPCGKCIECRKRISNEWKCRLLHEIDDHIFRNKKMHFITFTLSPEYYEQAKSDHYYYIRKFLEAYRYRSGGKTPRHFILTELGDKTGRLHYHGIIFDPALSAQVTLELWPWCEEQCKFVGYVQPKTASYLVKYMLKPSKWEDKKTWYIPRRYVSRGLGKCYCEDPVNRRIHNTGTRGRWYCTFEGYKLAVPRYYRDKLFDQSVIDANKIYFYENPPDEWSIGHIKYKDFNYYLNARRKTYKDTVRRGASIAYSYKPLKIDWSELKFSNEFNVAPFELKTKTIVKQQKLFNYGSTFS